jgi:glycosyltransferase involved in cell wall biosynthesis
MSFEKMVCMVGPFPPPVHGLSSVNLSVSGMLKAKDIKVVRMDLSPGSLERSPIYHIQRVLSALVCFAKILNITLLKHGVVSYISLSGGAGQLYDLCFVLIVRVLRGRLLIHHHSFAYLDSKSAVTGMLVRAAGPDTLHIVLYRSMEERLRELYGGNLHVKVVSNLIFSPQVLQSEKKKTIQTSLRLGFIGNVSFPKGIVEFIEVVNGLSSSGLSVEARIAGPFENKAVKEFTEDKIRKNGSIRYFGPVYEVEKRKFFEDLDVLLFPSKYKNEAAPLVILEALSYGIPVISTKRGCIAEILAGTGSLVFTEDRFVEGSIETIKGWVSKPEDYMARSLEAISRIETMRESIKEERERFISLFK